MSNQTDIFSMFNLVDEYSVNKKREEEEKRQKAEAERQAKQAEIRKKAQESAAKGKENKKAETQKEDRFDVNEDTVIRYYGESIEITSYFSPEELAEGLLVKKKDEQTERKPLEPEMLRKRMEKDFPELVKSHTEIVFLKEKNIIIPTMKAKKKGNCCEEEWSTDCSFLKKKITTKKIPFTILRDFIAVARIYGELHLEVHGDIYFEPKTDSFFLDIPKQTVNQVWVEVTEDAESIAKRVEDAFKLIEIHSHHSMAPIPSAQDNRSERVPGMLYAIVGRVDKFFPDLFMRQFISENNGYLAINPENVFEYPFYDLPEFETENIEVD